MWGWSSLNLTSCQTSFRWCAVEPWKMESDILASRPNFLRPGMFRKRIRQKPLYTFAHWISRCALAGVTEEQASVMRRRRSCRAGGGVVYTCPFMCPHKKKFNGFKSVEPIYETTIPDDLILECLH
ncbi:hypothetical protein AVEN_77541-1 [Araneus ventricosus]|uniref:Uncharacterized protein n=1 Tax=Araneus ventricosus TaxID=182803 RepID=A0A4Y2UI72_ARAVE|nr:hypothetical protein AVEN_77541-1 [Araneus ventricosus]